MGNQPWPQFQNVIRERPIELLIKSNFSEKSYLSFLTSNFLKVVIYCTFFERHEIPRSLKINVKSIIDKPIQTRNLFKICFGLSAQILSKFDVNKEFDYP